MFPKAGRTCRFKVELEFGLGLGLELWGRQFLLRLRMAPDGAGDRLENVSKPLKIRADFNVHIIKNS